MYQRCLVALAAVASILLPVWALARPAGSPAVIVVAAPWAPAGFAFDLVARADGAVLRGTGLTWVVVARSDDPGFPERLAAGGAWLVIDGSALAGCTGRAPVSQGTGS